VGDNQPITVDVRVVCATHRSLETMVAAGEFREDLLFRINTFEVTVPPLRDRLDDIPELVRHFVRQSRPQTPSEAIVAEPAFLDVLAAHRWPGNIRELANVVEHSLVLCDSLPLTVAHLPARLGGLKPAAEIRPAPASASTPTAPAANAKPVTLRELEMQAILESLERHRGNKPRAADELGISLKTLYNKLHQLQDTASERPA
jgi:two-component system NtrC family response regulator